jgi:hypothetical protein
VLDHLVVVARTLDEGSAWIEKRLGMPPGEGGRHDFMGTHNRLLSLGPDVYLEVISVDPGASPPPRPRWFGLDCRATRELMAKGPALIHWVERTDALEEAAAEAGEEVDILAFNRGPYRWRMALTRDGSLPGQGKRPTLIQWDSGHPAASLPHSGRKLLSLGGPGGKPARVATPQGIRTLPWTLAPGRE